MLCGIHYPHILGSQRHRREGSKENNSVRSRREGVEGARFRGIRSGSSRCGERAQGAVEGGQPTGMGEGLKADCLLTDEGEETEQVRAERTVGGGAVEAATGAVPVCDG